MRKKFKKNSRRQKAGTTERGNEGTTGMIIPRTYSIPGVIVVVVDVVDDDVVVVVVVDVVVIK